MDRKQIINLQEFICSQFNHDEMAVLLDELKGFPSFPMPHPQRPLRELSFVLTQYFELQAIVPVLLNILAQKKPESTEELKMLGWDGGAITDPMEWLKAGKPYQPHPNALTRYVKQVKQVKPAPELSELEKRRRAITSFMNQNLTQANIATWAKAEMPTWPDFSISNISSRLRRDVRVIIRYFNKRDALPVLLNFLAKQRPDLKEELKELGWDGGTIIDLREWVKAGRPSSEIFKNNPKPVEKETESISITETQSKPNKDDFPTFWKRLRNFFGLE